jgi:hypothetical protein
MGHCSVGSAGRDNNRAATEKITDYIIAPLKIGNYNENALFFATKLLQ